MILQVLTGRLAAAKLRLCNSEAEQPIWQQKPWIKTTGKIDHLWSPTNCFKKTSFEVNQRPFFSFWGHKTEKHPKQQRKHTKTTYFPGRPEPISTVSRSRSTCTLALSSIDHSSLGRAVEAASVHESAQSYLAMVIPPKGYSNLGFNPELVLLFAETCGLMLKTSTPARTTLDQAKPCKTEVPWSLLTRHLAGTAFGGWRQFEKVNGVHSSNFARPQEKISMWFHEKCFKGSTHLQPYFGPPHNFIPHRSSLAIRGPCPIAQLQETQGLLHQKVHGRSEVKEWLPVTYVTLCISRRHLKRFENQAAGTCGVVFHHISGWKHLETLAAAQALCRRPTPICTWHHHSRSANWRLQQRLRMSSLQNTPDLIPLWIITKIELQHFRATSPAPTFLWSSKWKTYRWMPSNMGRMTRTFQGQRSDLEASSGIEENMRGGSSRKPQSVIRYKLSISYNRYKVTECYRLQRAKNGDETWSWNLQTVWVSSLLCTLDFYDCLCWKSSVTWSPTHQMHSL